MTASRQQILDELQRILSSPRFKASKRRRQFLEFVVDKVLADQSESIKAYTIAVHVFGRNDDFTPQTDPIVSVEAGRLRRALEHYYLTDGATNQVRIEIPKGSFVPTFHIETNRTENTTKIVQDSVEGSGEKSIPSIERPAVAVVAFQNLSTEVQNEFYAAGICGQIVVNLYRYKEFAVVGPLNQAQINGPGQDMIGIGKRYKVQFVLSGTVQVRGGSVRITAWLVDTSTGENVWVKQYQHDKNVEALYAVEDSIAERIVATLADQIGVITRILVKRTDTKSCTDLTAYEATLKMYHWGIVLTEEAFYEAWQALENAAIKSPTNAPVKAMLANVYASDYLSEIGLVKNRLQRAEELARESVNCDPECPDSRWVMGFVYYLKRDSDKFVKEFEYALSLNPQNPMILAIYGLFLPGIGAWDQAIKLIDKARTLNPHLSGQYYIPSTLDYYRSGKYEEAYHESLKIKIPGLFWEPLIRVAVLGQIGKLDEAGTYIDKLLELQPSFPENGRELMNRLLYSDDNVTMVAEGLRKAGLEV